MKDRIYTKKDLEYYNSADALRFGERITLKDFLLMNDNWQLYWYLRHLRCLEYHLNNGHKLRTLFYKIIHKLECNKLHINTYPNTIGPGVRFYHIGNFTAISSQAKVGENCTFLSGVVIGNKNLKIKKNVQITIGNNCYFGLNCFIGGSITIGNNVTVGANAVVTKNIPDNAVVGGIPAKIIKFKDL